MSYKRIEIKKKASLLLCFTLAVQSYLLSQGNFNIENIIKEFNQVEICKIEALDDFFQYQWPDLYNPHALNISHEDLIDLFERLSEKIEDCPNNENLKTILAFYKYVEETSFVSYSDYKHLELLESLNDDILKFEGKLKVNYLSMLHWHFTNFYASTKNFSKATNYSNKTLAVLDQYDYDAYINVLFTSLFARTELALDQTLLSDIHKCRNRYETYIKSSGPDYYYHATLALVRFHTKQNNKDSAEYYLNTIDRNYIDKYEIRYLKEKADFFQKFAQYEAEEKTRLSIKEIYQQKRSNTILVDISLGKYYLRLHQYALAESHFNFALDQSTIKNGDLETIKSLPNYITALIGLSRAELSQNKVSEQKNRLNYIRELIDEHFKSLNAQKDKIHLLESFTDLFALIFQYKDELQFTDEALLEISEEAKSYTLLDAINLEKRLNQTLSDENFSKYQFTYESIINSKHKIKKDTSLTDEQVSMLKKQMGLYSETLDSLKQLVGEGEKQGFDFSTIDNISKDASIIEYFLHDTIGIAFLINDGQIETYDLEIQSSDLQELVNFKSMINDPSSDLTVFSEVSHSLYLKLLGKFHSKLKESITIIPHGPISSIPFEALVNDQKKFLVEKHNIRYAYSLSVLNEMQQKGSGGNRLLGFAPNYNFDKNVKSLGVLKHNKPELKSIEALVPDSKCFFAQEAEKASFNALASGYDIIHIAGHADVDAEDDDFSYIAFSDHTGNPDSTLLYLSSLYATNLNAEMIVLSACNTGLGTYKSGEGILSLARGFVHAGTASVVSTLWAVDDQSSTDLMINFYKGLKKGLSKNQALSESKRLILSKEENRHPYYWAGSVLIGDSASFENLHNYPWHIALFMLLAFFLFYLAIKKWRSDT